MECKKQHKMAANVKCHLGSNTAITQAGQAYTAVDKGRVMKGPALIVHNGINTGAIGVMASMMGHDTTCLMVPSQHPCTPKVCQLSCTQHLLTAATALADLEPHFCISAYEARVG